MEQLIEITSVPIQIEMKTSQARLESTRGTAEMEISRNKDGVSIHSRPIRVSMDSFHASGSQGPLPVRRVEQASYQADAAYSSRGQLMMSATLDRNAAAQLAEVSAQSAAQTAAPSAASGAEDWDTAELSVRYEMDKLNFDWKINQQGFEFTPGDIEVTVTQRPEVVIKYVGGPIYVPPSADPEYEPVDVKA